MKKFFQFLKKYFSLLWGFISTQYIRLRTYFNDGSFVVQFFPFLMHPLIRRSYFSVIKLFGVLISFCGVYYLLTEIIAILFSNVTLSAYINYTTQELLLPIGSTINEQPIRILSPMAKEMSAMFTVQGSCFLLAYLIGIGSIAEKRWHLLGVVCALFFTMGSLIISDGTGGKYTAGGLQNMGMMLTFLFGNLSILITGFDIGHHDLDKFKWFSRGAGLLGAVATVCSYVLANEFSPVLERLGIYSIMVWEILAGFAILKRAKHPGVYRNEQEN